MNETRKETEIHRNTGSGKERYTDKECKRKKSKKKSLVSRKKERKKEISSDSEDR